MNKRSAMFVAAGLVLSLLVAGIAMGMGVTGPSADAKTMSAKGQKPIVKTVTRTVTVHKKEKADGTVGAVIVKTLPASGSTSSPSGQTSAGGYEDDDQYESDEHESEDHTESEDPAGSEHESDDD
jgi:hypothetical protein